MTRPRFAAALLVALAAVALALPPVTARPAAAQAATGTVSGAIASGTQGLTIPDNVRVRLIGLDATKVADAVTATVSGGRYTATVPIVAGRLWVPHLVYEEVDYFSDPVTLTEASRTATRDFRVYGVTHEPPPLAIASTTVTVVAIDRERGQIGLLREDMVANPSDRVFVGDAAGVTLRLPAPTGTQEATGDESEGRFTLERGVLTTTQPIRPGRLTSVVTRYVVGYDRDADRYALRVTSPLPAERIGVRVPAGYVRDLQPGPGTRRAADEAAGAASQPGQQGQVLQVIQSTGSVGPGGGIVVNLVGLSAVAPQVNPLTEPRGAMAASALALLIVGGGTAAAWRRRGPAA